MSTDPTPRPANPAPPAPEFPWPDGKRCALFPGFDVDAESVWLGMDRRNADRLVTMSYGGYEARVGIPKLLELLARYEVKATFFITGWTAEAHPVACEAILKAGHEIGHHGYWHLRPEPGNLATMVEEVDRGFDALKRVLGVKPIGYRAPSGESFTELLALLRDRGIRYSSSWRDDIRPYRHVLPTGPGPIEIPVNYSFDDWNFGITHRMSPRALFGREEVLSIWRDEFDQTREWSGVATMIMHPQVSGRPMRYRILEEFLQYVRRYDDVWWTTGREIADHFEACESAAR
ncbi:polysaccharide deacetylase family protein [Microvirga lotononidis]|uniref:Chitooligosaccharide deacetylase n=1 Tax=Microvirga lotononidis TaxID=864069 RepID=I4Z1N5_9HYPH|nr:polysaccharide deacetylase [Microvirga lotononidis]EIM30127.1 putative xylanase/chitin deacetylase [Microvirga lotononidis]WQO31836.1 polysaccharide deacetylase [Microvirga lotononidis]